MTFLTGYSWSDLDILGIREDVIFYTSTGANYTHQHLYRLVVTSSIMYLEISSFPLVSIISTMKWFLLIGLQVYSNRF